MVRMLAELETKIVAVERIKEYCEAPTEAPWEEPEARPGMDWPREGRISFQEYQTRYRDELEPVLKGISVEIKGGEKVSLGIVEDDDLGSILAYIAIYNIGYDVSACQ